MHLDLTRPLVTRDGRQAVLVKDTPPYTPQIDDYPGGWDGHPWFAAHVRFRGSNHGGLFCFRMDGTSYDPNDRNLDLQNQEGGPRE